MILLILAGAVFAFFMAIARGRRRARRGRPAPGQFTILPRTRPGSPDSTDGLRDPARPF
jgi:hypothetical protein